MPKIISPERPSLKQHVPAAPEPSATSAPEGMERARALARCYLPNTVHLLAGIALGPDSEAGLHTRMLAAKTIVEIAGVIPQATPAPPNERASDGDGEVD
jgi:hypothetical protein